MAIISQIFTKIRRWLRTSSHIHIREHGVRSLNDVVDLIDRFIDDRVIYDLEWDDFISWPHENICICTIISHISQYEYLLFSEFPADRVAYILHLTEERNRIAASIGMSARKLPASDA
ncbi:hypothetical protein [Magnetospirillum aberrantis]|uniref:Uncharacterized protein n=1 Tax=Magnetospirillum aberrantis SpK TaxID=908842 RepID=A0A7C9UUB7_9PROT|nr:hypothetical protein [Magnetospirillum aberrantis]NFV79189.1 hypothetical protein [Magnetospirillum aberrantis SpK]